MLKELIPVLLAVVLIGLCGSPSRSQEWGVHKQITEAVESYRRGNPTQLLELSESANTDRLLSGLICLEGYAADPDPDVRLGVAVLVQNVRNSRVLPLLTTLVNDDSSVSHLAVDILLRNFGRREIAGASAAGLQNALIDYASREPALVRGKALLLLSCFRSDKAVSRFLENLRSVSEKQNSLVSIYVVHVPARIGIDLALAELGDKEALGRTREVLSCNDDDKAIIFLLECLRFIDDDVLLDELVRMTREKRDALFTSDGTTLRMCDIAVSMFAEALGPEVVGAPILHVSRYSDAQLATATSRLMAWLASRHSPTGRHEGSTRTWQAASHCFGKRVDVDRFRPWGLAGRSRVYSQ